MASQVLKAGCDADGGSVDASGHPVGFIRRSLWCAMELTGAQVSSAAVGFADWSSAAGGVQFLRVSICLRPQTRNSPAIATTGPSGQFSFFALET